MAAGSRTPLDGEAEAEEVKEEEKEEKEEEELEEEEEEEEEEYSEGCTSSLTRFLPGPREPVGRRYSSPAFLLILRKVHLKRIS